jgi:serine/threonine protein kinase
MDVHTGAAVAIKTIRNTSREGIPKAIFREMETLRQMCNCRYIVQMLDVFVEENNVVLVLEYLCSDLGEVIGQAEAPLGRAVVKGYLKMCLTALRFCHERGVIHRDIKPSNILLTAAGTVKLGDFGLARVLPPGFDGSLSHQVATRWYRAPELLFASRHYGSAADMWSLGAVAAELITLTPLFPGSNDIDQIYRVFQIMGTPTKDSWPDADRLPDFKKVSFPDMACVDPRVLMPHAHDDDVSFLFQALLLLDPTRRATCHDALQDPYFLAAPLPATSGDLPAPLRRKAPTRPQAKDMAYATVKEFCDGVLHCNM